MRLMVHYLVFRHFPRFSSACTYIRENRRPHPQTWGETQKSSSTSPPRGRFLVSTPLAAARSAAFALHRETMMDDDLKDVQPHPVQLNQIKLRPSAGAEG